MQKWAMQPPATDDPKPKPKLLDVPNKRDSGALFFCPVCGVPLAEDSLLAHIDQCSLDSDDAEDSLIDSGDSENDECVPTVPIIGTSSPPLSPRSIAVQNVVSMPPPVPARIHDGEQAENSDQTSEKLEAANVKEEKAPFILPAVSEFVPAHYREAKYVKVVRTWEPESKVELRLVVGDVIEILRHKKPPADKERKALLSIEGDPKTLWMFKGALFGELGMFPVGCTVPTTEAPVKRTTSLRPDDLMQARKVAEMAGISSAQAVLPADLENYGKAVKSLSAREEKKLHRARSDLELQSRAKQKEADSHIISASSSKSGKVHRFSRKPLRAKKLKGKEAEIARLSQLGMRKQYNSMRLSEAPVEIENLEASVASLRRQVDLGRRQQAELSDAQRRSVKGQRLAATVADMEANLRVLENEVVQRRREEASTAAPASTSLPVSFEWATAAPVLTSVPAADEAGNIAQESTPADSIASRSWKMPSMNTYTNASFIGEARRNLSDSAQVGDSNSSKLESKAGRKVVSESAPPGTTNAARMARATVLTATRPVVSAIHAIRSGASMRNLIITCDDLEIKGADECDSKEELLQLLRNFAIEECSKLTLKGLIGLCETLGVGGVDALETKAEFLSAIARFSNASC